MNLKYVPDTTEVGPVDFRPYMLEVAWNYCQLVLGSSLQRGMIEQTLAALAIEIVLKSYNSVVISNAGELNETYQFQVPAGSKKVANKHNLVALAALLRKDVRQYLIEPLDEEALQEHQDAFSNSRYFYEPSAPKSSSDAAMKLAAKLICKTLFLYKQRGCDDPFVTAFDVNTVFFTHVQRYVFAPASAA
jgi:hypothetical protein